MAYIILPSRRLRRPTGRTQVIPEHALAPCFYASMSPADGTTVYRDGAWSSQSTVSWSGSNAYAYAPGGGAYYNGSGSTYLDLGGPPLASATQPFTVAWYERPSAVSGFYGIATWLPSGASNRFMLCRASSGNAPYLLHAGIGNGTAIPCANVADTIMVAGEGSRFLVTAAGGASSNTVADYSYYKNGLSKSGAFNTSGGFGSATASNHYVGWYNAGDSKFTGLLGDFAIWPRVLTRAEIAEYYNAPFQFLQSERRVLYFGAAPAATGNTIAVPAGALTLTGYAPTVTATANQTVAVPAGALVLTAYAPSITVSADQIIQVPTGALALTGFAPTVTATAHQTVAVPAGALTLTGFAPNVTSNANQTIQVPAGTLALTGYAPTVAATANQTVEVPARELNLTGYAPTVSDGTTGGWRGPGGDDEPWWANIPTKPLAKKVERAIEAAAKVAPLEARAVLTKKIERAGVEWSDDYDALLSLMYEREAKTLAELRRQVAEAAQAAPYIQANVVAVDMIARENEEVLLLLLT